jgi:chloride channel 2
VSGVSIIRYLSIDTYVAKFIGLISAHAAGFSIGKEGPFVHMAAIIAHNLQEFSIFERVRNNATLKQQIMIAAVAAGVVTTFGAPIGGILFSIEVTATYYVVDNLWKAFFCSMWCVLFYGLLQMTEVTDLFAVEELHRVEFGVDAAVFVFIGVLCAFLGSLFIHVSSKLIIFRKYGPIKFLRNRYVFGFTCILIISGLTYPLEFMHKPDKGLIKQLFSPDSLSFFKY